MAVPNAPEGSARPPVELSSAELASAVNQSLPFLRRTIEARGELVTDMHGGDVVTWRSPRNLQRHVANYLAAIRLGAPEAPPQRHLDVGCGTGALAAWSADLLDARLELVDADAAMRSIASQAFGDAQVTADMADATPADLVTAMEVIEHVVPAEQHGFVAALFAKVTPGGCLVVSTPDESAYPFGHSGYRPHVGVLDAGGLRTLLEQVTGQPVEVWRLDGGPFVASRARLWMEWVLNHVWGWAMVQGPVERLGKLLIRRTRKPPVEPSGVDDVAPVTLQVQTTDPLGTGTGLIARVVKPR